MVELIVIVNGRQYRTRLGRDSLVEIENEMHTCDLTRIDEYLFSLIIDDRSFDIIVEERTQSSLQLKVCGYSTNVEIQDERLQLAQKIGITVLQSSQLITLVAPMPGMVSRVQVKLNERVAKGGELLVLEAMKMENEIRSPVDGIIKKIQVTEKSRVEKNASLLIIESI